MKFDEAFIDKTVDYVMLMLGAPVIKLELTPEQIRACILQANADVETYFSVYPVKALRDNVREDLVRSKALIESMFVLVRIRGKYKNMPSPTGKIDLDSKELYNFAKLKLEEWHDKRITIQEKWGNG